MPVLWEDGHVTIFKVMHRWNREKPWADSNVGSFLRTGQPKAFHGSPEAIAHKTLLRPYHDCWQQTGQHGFLDEEDARYVAHLCAKRNPKHAFGVMRVELEQKQTLVWQSPRLKNPELLSV